jgi:hypothetical protein
VVLETVQECVYKGLSLEEFIPFWIIKIGCDDWGFPAVAFPHKFEESIDLFGFEGEVWESKDGALSLRDKTKESILSIKGLGAKEARAELEEIEGKGKKR